MIDDVSLARAVKQLGEPIRLAVSRSDVESLRAHDFDGVWRMVRRTAFTELRHSWALLAVTLVLLLLLFAAAPVLAIVGIGLVATGATSLAVLLTLAASAASSAAMSAVYLPTVRYFRLAPVWAVTLPLAACLYGAMTLDSAIRSRRTVW